MNKLRIIVILFFILTLLSCSNVKTLEVYMDGSQKTLKTGNRYITLDDYSEGRYELYNVSLVDNHLIVGKSMKSQKDYSVRPNYYSYYVGLDFGEFGGWVEYGINNNGTPEEIKIILNENCKGFIIPRLGENDVILLTGLNHMGYDWGRMYILNDGNVREVYDFNSCPQAHIWDSDDEILYIKTHDKIYSYKLDGEVKVLYEFCSDYEDTYDFYTNNIIKQENSLIFGSIIGIFEFNLDTQEKYWYPLIEK